MENKDAGIITPIESVWPPKGLVARTIHGLTKNGGVTKDLLSFLQKETPPPLKAPHKSEVIVFGLDDALNYFRSEIDFYKRYYPDDSRYPPHLERGRAQAKFFEKCIAKKDYIPLIRHCLDESLKAHGLAQKQAQRYEEMPATERLRMEKQRKESIKALEKFSETHDPDNLGFPPEFFEASGRENEVRSQAFYTYAVCFAKTIK